MSWEAPKHLARTVHDLYFEPQVRGLQTANNLESLERVYLCLQATGPIPQLKTTAKLAEFLETRLSQPF